MPIVDRNYFRNENEISNGITIPEKLIGYNTIIDYLPTSIGFYRNFLPPKYFATLFHKSKTLYKRIGKGEAEYLYKTEIANLKNIILSALELYKQRIKETDILKDKTLFVKERHSILNKLITMKDIDSDDKNPNYIIKYITTNPHPEFAENNEIITHIDHDVLDLLGNLYRISSLSKRLKDNSINSFRLFCKNIIIHMRANLEENYPKSIVNYTCFMFSIEGYPYCTPSKRIYTINNYPKNIDNKLNYVIIYMKNTDALISYFFDIVFNTKNKTDMQIEENIIRTAYCLCIALLAYRSEYVEYNYITQNLFGTRGRQ
jgi:hypothetical protein